MLILTRNSGQSLRIGNEVEVKVLAIKGSQVRLGFTAPPELPVNRQEIAQKIAARAQASIRKNDDRCS
ncbi:MAG: carbon storage regulator [Proteobacteria bacterium]|nr:carbon storage regulator [Pseudomonadota bacterium]